MFNHGDHPYMREKARAWTKAFNFDMVVIRLGTNGSKPRNRNKCGKE